MSFQITSEIVSTFGSAAAGALLGSLSAFGLGLYQQHRDKRAKQESALLQAQYALMSQWNILEDVKRNFLDPHRKDANRFLKPPYHSFARHVSVPFDDIAFIVSSDEANLLQQIHIAEQGFETAIESLRLRNQRMEEFYKLEPDRFDFETGAASFSKFSADRDAFLLKRITDSVYEVFDKALPKLLGEGQALEGFIRRKYKGVKPLRLVVPE